MVKYPDLAVDLDRVGSADDFEDLGPLEDEEPADEAGDFEPWMRSLTDALEARTEARWLIDDQLERGVIAVMAGPRGSFKSFAAIDWGMRVALFGAPVVIVSAEGNDFDRRARAWLKAFAPGTPIAQVPVYVIERRFNMSDKAGIERLRQECSNSNISPVLFVLDTFSKLKGPLDENSNTEVAAFIGLLDNGLKRPFDATVLLIAHTGHSDNTRARGAYSLGADSDAEYIVTRHENNKVSISRERFKSSGELEPIYLVAEIIQLGYTDKKGNPVTSLVLRPTESVEQSSRTSKKMGLNQLLVRKALKDLFSESGGKPVAIKDLIGLAMEGKTLEPGKRDHREKHLVRALDTFMLHGPYHKRGEFVSRESGFIDEIGEEAFDDSNEEQNND